MHVGLNSNPKLVSQIQDNLKFIITNLENMALKVNQRSIVFRYGALKKQELAEVDAKQFYIAQGGKIEPETFVQFSSYFPGAPYSKTALTSSMPPKYLCRGSINAHFCQSDGNVDVVSISVYQDTTKKAGKSARGVHFNLFLQYDINGVRKHTDKIPNRHIPLWEGVVLKAFVGERGILKEAIPAIKS